MTAIKPADLYSIGMESPTAWQLMPELCAALGVEFPPQQPAPDTARRDALPDPFSTGSPAPSMLAFN